MRRNRLITPALASIAGLALGVSGGSSAISARSSSLALPLPSTNGTVVASAVSGSTLYIGGAFSEVGPNTGAFTAISSSSGKAAPPQPRFNGGVSAIVSDHHGGWYVGRLNTNASSVPSRSLTHVLPSGSLDPRFKPVLGDVASLALSPNGKRLYVGAFFLKGGVPINEVGALDATTGRTIKTFAAVAFGGAQPPAIALSPDGSVLYLSLIHI